MKEEHQAIDDMREINPHTGLPKHVYELTHKECIAPFIRGSFQKQGKKYHTSRYSFTNGDERQVAIENVLEELHDLKQEVGWYEYVKDEGWRKKVRRTYQHESLYPKDRESDGSSMEGSGSSTIRRIKHIDSSDGIPGI